MKLKALIKQLTEIANQHSGDMEVILSTDAEGNAFRPLYADSVTCCDIAKMKHELLPLAPEDVKNYKNAGVTVEWSVVIFPSD